ncbi:DUF421 domain-containing protein [Persicimonas caeni]|uniref:DUF421 domain-containing protein n=1 Tax=Persicimonas caeni TaxID=2292766 RepID=A0A4Y6Q0K8_PERCE|nr:YetF domain-containing protein [Persicimonas caeni]QDG54116.1 DUF421 domain-containing protein [Persicimonas caeni]QED35337.1 DUF421 domain-containing protein [Persicimonas caeni]
MDWFHTLIGQSSSTIEWWQMTIRAMLVLVFAVAYIRIGGARMFGKHTVLDIVLGVVLGSNFSRALTGNAPFIPTMIASAALVAAHYGLARVARHVQIVENLVKGRRTKLGHDGELFADKMRETGVSEEDIEEAMRSYATEPDFSKIKEAYLERSGAITIIMYEDEEEEAEDEEQEQEH